MRKVQDHNHYTGYYRGAVHFYYNLTLKNPKFILTCFHRLAGYDAHLFVKEFCDDKKKINLISNNEENYISFSKMIRYKFY